jgi:hypothetical protein
MSKQSAIDHILNGPAPTPLIPAAITEELRASREHMRSRLQASVMIVEFNKVDGTPSVMECTLDSRLIPPAPQTGGPAAAPQDADYLRVYSLDRQGWRSFKVANVTKFYQGAENL